MCDGLRRVSRRPSPSDPRPSPKGIDSGLEPGSSLLLKGNETRSRFPFESEESPASASPPIAISYTYRYLESKSSPTGWRSSAAITTISRLYSKTFPVLSPNLRHDLPRIPASPRVASTSSTFFSIFAASCCDFRELSRALRHVPRARELLTRRLLAFRALSLGS